MIVNEFIGDLFDSTGPIAHGCNCKGAMGAGVARIVRSRYPVIYENYKFMCDHGLFRPGEGFVMLQKGRMVFNLAIQDLPGPHATLRYIEQSFSWMDRAINTIDDIDFVNIPRIGCGIGGLKWNDVKHEIESIDSDLEIRVWTLEE